MRNHNRIFTLLLLSVFISCNGQNTIQQEKADDITISLTRKATLDFSLVDGHFDKVYGNVNGGFLDKAGNLWFGTTGAGAIRYDGKFFTHFTTKDKFGNNSVIPLLEDKQGNIWFSTADGICRYDGKTFTSIPIIRAEQNNLQPFTLSNSSNRTTSALTVTSAMQDTKGNIWIGTELNGVYRYDGKAFTALLSKGIINAGGLRLNTIKCILEDKKGIIWFASWNNEGVCRYDGNSLVSYTSKNGPADNMIYSLLEDAVGNIWIGTRNHGVWRYDGKSFSNISADTDLKDECIYSIAQDKLGHLWFSTQSKGVWRFDGKLFTNFTTKDGLSNNSVFSIVADDKGIIWFGTRGMGLCSYNGKTFKNFTVRSH